MLAFYSKLNPANKWVLLRSSAEAIKRAIYIYRTRPVIYPKTSPDGKGQQDLVDEEDLEQASREVELYSRLKSINSQLMQTDVNLAALPAYEDGYFPKNAINPNDNGFRFLLPQDYIKLRLEDQLNWFRGKVVKMERELRWFQAIILIIGGVGTFLAAIEQEIWVALTTSLLTALTTYLQYKQTEHTLMQYNQTAANLANISSWWLSLTPDQQVSPAMVSRLVRTTEKILETESVGWVQQMKDALAELQKEEEVVTPAQNGRTVIEISPETTFVAQPGDGEAEQAEKDLDGGKSGQL